MKSKTGLIVTGALLLSGVVSGYWYYMAPRSNPDLEEDLTALKAMGVPTTLNELEALRQGGSPAAATFYNKAVADYDTAVAALSKADLDELLAYGPGKGDAQKHLKQIDALEHVWKTLKRGTSQKEFVPDMPMMDWEERGNRVVMDNYRLANYLQARMWVAAGVGQKDRALETLELALKMSGQVGSFPGSTANIIALIHYDLAMHRLADLASTFPEDKELNERMLAIAERSKIPDHKSAYLLKPAFAFTILDSKGRLPWPYSPNGYQNPMPTPAKFFLVESRRARQGAKEILADHFRNLFENFPEDQTDAEAISQLLLDERFDERTFEGELATILGSVNWYSTAGSTSHKARQKAIDAIKSNLSK